jgi:ureidoacrylate peracid hydrolase
MRRSEINLIGNTTIDALPDKIKIDFSKTAILVIDMQNAFVKKGGYFDFIGLDISTTEMIVGPCKEIISLGREKGMKVIYLQMGYSPDLSDSGGPSSPNFLKSRALTLISKKPELRDKLYIYGTWGADIIDDLRPQQGDVIVKKQKHDGFIGTNLDIILRTYEIKHLLFIGTATNICVESTLRHAFSLGYFPILVSDATSPMGPPFAQEATISNVQSTFGWVTTTEKLLTGVKEI